MAATFSGSKGGTGKTTLAINISIVASALAPTLLVDASSEGGATAYLFGDAPPPYLRDDPQNSLRRLDIGGHALTVAVNRGPLDDIETAVSHIKHWSESYPFTVVDLPALTDTRVRVRYLPILAMADVVLVVVEPNIASIESSLYTFGDKRVVVALNCPRPYPKTVVEHYARVIESFCRRTGADYVVVPYDPAVSRAPGRLRFLEYTSPEYDSAIVQLLRLLRKE